MFRVFTLKIWNMLILKKDAGDFFIFFSGIKKLGQPLCYN